MVDFVALLRSLLFERCALECHRKTLGERLQLFEMVHGHDAVRFGAVGMQNPDCPALNGDRGADIAEAAGGLDDAP